MIHELKHHMTNVGVAQAAVARLKQDMPRIIAEIERRQPYIGRGDIDGTFKFMEAELQDLLSEYLSAYMKAEMKRLNGKIDSPEEYMTGSALLRQCGSD
jgi:hypothetical protein